MDTIFEFFESYPYVRDALLGVGILLLAWLALTVTRKVLVRLLRTLTRKTANTWDDALAERKVFGRMAWLAPVLVLSYGAGFFPYLDAYAPRFINVCLLLVVVAALDGLLAAVTSIYQNHPRFQRRPIKGPMQLVRLFLYLLALVALVAFLIGQSPWGLLSGIGAFTAVLLLVFRDTILSFVVGMQIVAGDHIRRGDWITVPAFCADGDVIDIALHTVKVQNFDKTVVTIPTYKLLDGAFTNWRGMAEAGARRIKRSLRIDQASVNFVDDKLLASLNKIGLLQPYLLERGAAIEAANREKGVDTSHPVNGRRMTNLGCFRAYAEQYLRNHPHIHGDLTVMVRQLQPTEEGVPLEIYCFTTITEWVQHEAIQSDIFDHLLAAMPWFRLRAYQRSQYVDDRVPGELF